MVIAMVVRPAYRTDNETNALVGTLPAGRVVRILRQVGVDHHGNAVYHVDASDRWAYWPMPDDALVFDPEFESVD